MRTDLEKANYTSVLPGEIIKINSIESSIKHRIGLTWRHKKDVFVQGCDITLIFRKGVSIWEKMFPIETMFYLFQIFKNYLLYVNPLQRTGIVLVYIYLLTK
jgi:hypothetical protein